MLVFNVFDVVIIGFCMLIGGFAIGLLTQRWIYFKKTGKHLNDL